MNYPTGTFLLAVTCLGGIVAADAATDEYRPTGVLPLARELRELGDTTLHWIREPGELTPSGRAPRTLPTSCRNTLYLPVVRSQLLANCGAYAPSYYYKTYQEAREHGWVHPDPNVDPEHVMSPGFTFPLTNRGVNNGAGLYTVLRVICRYGIATWADMPESRTWWEYPGDEIWPKALPYRGDHVIGFDLSAPGGLQALKQHLADGDLGVFAVPVSVNFRSYPLGDGVDNDVLYANGDIYDFHALTLVGYDDTKTYNDGTGVKSGAFLAVNSWGGWGVVEPSVGTGGFCWLSYEYMQNRRAGETGVLAMVDRTNYVPREVARIEVRHNARSELAMSIGAGNGVGSTNALDAFPRGGGSLGYFGTITVDVTDFMADQPVEYHLFAMDWDTALVGTIQHFEVEKANGMVMVCPDTPATLLNSDPLDPSSWHSTRLDAGVLMGKDMLVWETPLQTPVFAWVDFDRDGDADYAVFGNNGTNSHSDVYLNDGDGGFSRLQLPLPALNSVFLAWGDYNRDGYPDLAVSGRNGALQPTMLLLRNEAGESLVDSGISFPQVEAALAWGDYDQDGDVDLATSKGKLFRNNNGTSFTDTGFALIGGGTQKSVSWADIDNDGLLDLEIGGKVNQNLGGSFTNDTLNPITVGTAQDRPPIWHDFNGDGLLDAAANGRIYANMGYTYSLGYHDPEHPEWDIPDQWRLWFYGPSLVYSNWAWPRISAGDFDNDGDLDFALSGAVGSSADVRFSVFRRETNQTFTDIGLRCPGFYYGAAGWQDWDGDGDLDLLAGGMDSVFDPQLQTLENHLADWGRPNAVPEAPLRFQVTQAGSSVLLQWHPGRDAETPTGQLTYDVRVGTTSGGIDVVSPCNTGPCSGNARLIGALSLPTSPYPYQLFFNTNGLPGIRLRGLASGRYRWSVQTIDGIGARSAWSPEQAFTITAAGLRTGDINGDGKVDIADLVRCRKMISGSVTPNVATADMNDDGTVNEPDAVVLMHLLTEVGANGYVPVATATLGPAGGTLASGPFALTVPAGAFPEATPLELLVSADDRPLGEDSPRLMWRIEGLPSDMTGTLTLSGPDWRATPTTQVAMAVGQLARPHGVNDDTLEPILTYMTVPGTAVGGRLVSQLPASLLHGAAGAESGTRSLSTRGSPSGWKFGIDAGWFWDAYYLTTTHFKIKWEGLTPSYVNTLGQKLEEAFDKYKTLGYPFETKRNWTEYPVQVSLEKLSDEGGEVHTTDNGAYIQLNIERLKLSNILRTTSYHEFFHLVQGLVNPSYSITEARDNNLLLVNEATATWMERFGSDDPGTYVPPNYGENQLLVFDGLSYGAKKAAAKTGYALSSMIEYLAGRFGETTVRNIYTRLASGDNAVNAVLNSVPAGTGTGWHADFYRALVQGSVYSASPLLQVSPKLTPLWPTREHTFTAVSNTATVASFTFNLPGLGADGCRYAFTPGVATAMSNTSVLALSLKNPRQDLDLSVISAKNRADPPGTVTVDDYGTKPDIIRLRVMDLKSALLPLPVYPKQESMRSFVALITRTDLTERDTLRPAELKIAVADKLDGPFRLGPFDSGQFWWNDENVSFPQFSCTATLTPSDLTGLCYKWTGESQPGDVMGHFYLDLFHDGDVEVPFSFSAPRTGPIEKDVYEPGSTTDFYRFTFKSMDGYTMFKRIYGGPELEDQPYVFESRPFGGSEILRLDEGEDHAYYGIEVKFTIDAEYYGGGAPSGTTSTFALWTTPVIVHLNRE